MTKISTILPVLLCCLIVASLRAQGSNNYLQDGMGTMRGPVKLVTAHDSVLEEFGAPVRTSRWGRFVARFNAHGFAEYSKSTMLGSADSCAYTFDADGCVTHVNFYAIAREPRIRSAKTGAADSSCVRRQEFHYGAHGMIADIRILNGPDDSLLWRMRCLYDVQGRVKQVDRYEGVWQKHTAMLTWARSGDGGYTVTRDDLEADTVAVRTLYEYDARGFVLSDSSWCTDAGVSGETWPYCRRYTNDSLGNPIMLVTWRGSDKHDTVRYEYRYDAHGNWVTRALYQRAASGHHDRHPSGPWRKHSITSREIEYYGRDTASTAECPSRTVLREAFGLVGP